MGPGMTCKSPLSSTQIPSCCLKFSAAGGSEVEGLKKQRWKAPRVLADQSIFCTSCSSKAVAGCSCRRSCWFCVHLFFLSSCHFAVGLSCDGGMLRCMSCNHCCAFCCCIHWFASWVCCCCCVIWYCWDIICWANICCWAIIWEVAASWAICTGLCPPANIEKLTDPKRAPGAREKIWNLRFLSWKVRFKIKMLYKSREDVKKKQKLFLFFLECRGCVLWYLSNPHPLCPNLTHLNPSRWLEGFVAKLQDCQMVETKIPPVHFLGRKKKKTNFWAQSSEL